MSKESAQSTRTKRESDKERERKRVILGDRYVEIVLEREIGIYRIRIRIRTRIVFNVNKVKLLATLYLIM